MVVECLTQIQNHELVIAYLFSHILSFRLGIEISNILHKSDLVSHSKIKRLLNNPTDLINDLKNEKGTIVDLTLLILKHLLDLYPLSRLISTSIYGNIGFAELYDLINERNFAKSRILPSFINRNLNYGFT